MICWKAAQSFGDPIIFAGPSCLAVPIGRRIKANDCEANEIECANRSAPWSRNFGKLKISRKIEDLGRFQALNRSGVLAGANFIAYGARASIPHDS